MPKSSPEFLLKPDESKELLIQCCITGSKESINKVWQELYENYKKFIYSPSTSTEKEKSQKQKFLNDALNKHSTDILSNIKMEDGEHTLICKINYKYRHFFKTIKKKTESKININITEDALKRYKDSDNNTKLSF